MQWLPQQIQLTVIQPFTLSEDRARRQAITPSSCRRNEDSKQQEIRRLQALTPHHAGLAVGSKALHRLTSSLAAKLLGAGGGGGYDTEGYGPEKVCF